ncbi:hypothetical protein SESBI_32349 [Sesbania bispinosa]|nr:hypothetical protein SESBI_32349 [Sesbania bispinosa]
MSGSNLSDSQNLSKSESLLSENSSNATETDSIFDSSATETSVTSRPPTNTTIPDRMPELEIPVINLSDEGSPILNDENNPNNENPSLDQGLDTSRNVPKIYVNFISEVVRYSSRYTNMSSIFSFGKNTVITSLDLDKTILIEPCTENEKVPQTRLSLLSEEDRAAVEWLREQKPIDCSTLLENEDNPAELQALLGSMPPKSQITKTMDEVAMIKALRAREKKGDGGNPSSQCKKQKVDDGGNPGGANLKPPPSGSTQNITSNAPPNPVPGSSEKWWTLFNDFEGATSDVVSIFYRLFPIDQIVKKHLNRKEDRTRVHKARMKNIGKNLQSSGAQMAFFGPCVDQYVGSAEKELENLLLKNNELTEKLKNVEGDIKTVERLKTDLQASEKKNTDLLAEKRIKVSTLTTEKENLISGKELADAEIGDLKAQIAMQHTFGFEKAVGQVKFLYPDLKVDEVGAFKHVVDGKLVDIVVDEDEE